MVGLHNTSRMEKTLSINWGEIVGVIPIGLFQSCLIHGHGSNALSVSWHWQVDYKETSFVIGETHQTTLFYN